MMVNLYDHVTPFSSPDNIQRKGMDIHSPLPLILKASKQGEGVPFCLLPSPFLPPFTLLLSSPSKLPNTP